MYVAAGLVEDEVQVSLSAWKGQLGKLSGRFVYICSNPIITLWGLGRMTRFSFAEDLNPRIDKSTWTLSNAELLLSKPASVEAAPSPRLSKGSSRNFELRKAGFEFGNIEFGLRYKNIIPVN
jgi:hypothetical protein